jgi:hypothetical protein
VFLQSVFKDLAWCVGIVVAAVGERELLLAGVDTGSDAFVEQRKADDAILSLSNDATTQALYLVAADR